MPDNKIDVKENSFGKGLKSSLASRFISIILGCLVLPCALLSVIAYTHEYDANKRNNFNALYLVSDQVRSVINQYIAGDTSLMNTLTFFLTNSRMLDSGKTEERLSHLFAGLQKSDHVSNVIYAEWEGDRLIGRVSGAGGGAGVNYAEYFANLQDEKGVFFSNYPAYESNLQAMLIAKNISFNRETGKKGVLFFIVSPEEFQEKLESRTQVRFPVSISIVSPNGDVLLSTREDFFNKKFVVNDTSKDLRLTRNEIVLRTAEMRQNYYTCVFDGDKKMVIYLPLQDQYRVLVEMSESANIINVPKYFLHILLILLVIVIGGMIAALMLTLRIAEPLRKLCGVISRVGKGNRSLRFKPARFGYEINLVGRHLNEMLEGVSKQIEQIKKERGHKEKVSRELLIGQKIQTSLFPPKIPEHAGLKMAGGSLSAKEVGGDFYDVVARNNTEILFCIADVAGRGISACMLSLSVRSIIRANFLSGQSLDQIIINTNNAALLETEATSSFVKLWCAVYSIESKTLSYVSCGHSPAFHKKGDGTIDELQGSEMAVGVRPLQSVVVSSAQMELGEQLLLVTDGILDAHNTESERYGKKRVQSVLQAVTSYNPQEVVDTMLQEAKRFSKGVAQEDDMTALSLQVLPFEAQQ